LRLASAASGSHAYPPPILYDSEVHAELARVIKSTLSSKGTLLLADPGRPQALEFLGRLEDEGLRFELQTHRVGHASLLERGEIDVLLAWTR
jgi:hypothetical protein